MFPVKEFEKRFREILASLDEFRNENDEIEEMNAEFEDALFVIECIDVNDEEWQEEFTDALDEFEDLLDGYRGMTDELPELSGIADRLDMAIKMAQANLKLV